MEVDPTLWRGVVGTVEVHLDRKRVLVPIAAILGVTVLVLADREADAVLRAFGYFMLFFCSHLVVWLVADRKPYVIVSDVGIAVRSERLLVLRSYRAIAWQDVVDVTPPAWPPRIQAQQSGRIPLHPRWSEASLPREFRVVPSSGPPLVVSEPLKGWALGALNGEVRARWRRLGGSAGALEVS